MWVVEPGVILQNCVEDSKPGMRLSNGSHSAEAACLQSFKLSVRHQVDSAMHVL